MEKKLPKTKKPDSKPKMVVLEICQNCKYYSKPKCIVDSEVENHYTARKQNCDNFIARKNALKVDVNEVRRKDEQTNKFLAGYSGK